MNASRTNLPKIIRAILAGSLTLSLLGCGGGTMRTVKERKEEIRKIHRGNLSALAAQTAEQDFRVGNLEQALGNINTAIKAEPTNAKHFVMRGRILYEMNELQAARGSLLHALKLDETNALAEYYVALIYQRWSNDQQASEHYARATELAPTMVEFALAYVESLIALNQLETAHQFINDTLVQFEHEPAFKRAEGHIFLIENKPTKAAASFYQAMLLNPDDLSITESLIHAYTQAGDYARSQYYLERLLSNPRTADRADLKHLMARCLAASDRLLEAREAYIELTTNDRTNLVLWTELGIVAIELGDYRRAENAARTMISMWPRKAEGYLLNGRIAEIDHNFENAVKNYRKAAALADDREEIFIFLGMALEKIGAFKQARINYTKALAINPQNPGTTQLLRGIAQRQTAAITAAVPEQPG